MIQKNRRTVDTYMKVGAKMRLFKMLGTRTAVEISQVLSATDTQKLMRALDKVDRQYVPRPSGSYGRVFGRVLR